jgi:hypothetical protein
MIALGYASENALLFANYCQGTRLKHRCELHPIQQYLKDQDEMTCQWIGFIEDGSGDV